MTYTYILSLFHLLAHINSENGLIGGPTSERVGRNENGSRAQSLNSHFLMIQFDPGPEEASEAAHGAVSTPGFVPSL